MPEFGFPSQPRNHQMSLLIDTLRQRSNDARVESVTGRYSDITAKQGGRVDELMQLEKALSDIADYSESIVLAEARGTTMQSALEKIGDIAQRLADTTDLLSTNGTDQNFEAVSAQAREEFGSVVSALNVQFAGRPLFAGDGGNGAAILDAASIQTLGVPFLEGATSASVAYSTLMTEFTGAGLSYDTSVYLGGTGSAPDAEVAPGERIAYHAKADEAPLRTVLANVVALGAAFDMTNAIPDTQRRQIAQLASEGLRSDTSHIVGIRGRVGAAEERIANLKARNTATEASLTISFNNVAGADQLNAAIELTEFERQLETAFATTARMSNLSLANFL